MRYRVLPIILLFAVVAIILYSIPHDSSRTDTLLLSAADAHRRRHALIIDVRTPKERETLGFFPGSIPIDPSQITEEVPFLLGQKPGRLQTPRPTPILVYSHIGDNRAQSVAQQLYDLGWIGTRYIKGSYLELLPPGPLPSTE